ncbi:MAG: class I SAM-dependent methyltransferase [Pseudomonadota bacterium]
MALTGPSQTAIRCARARACHMIVDAKPWIYEDHIAGKFVDIDRQIAEGYDLEEVKKPHITQTRAVMAIRERYGEDALDEAVERGATQ